MDGRVYLRTDRGMLRADGRGLWSQSAFSRIDTPDDLKQITTDFEREFNAEGIPTNHSAWQLTEPCSCERERADSGIRPNHLLAHARGYIGIEEIIAEPIGLLRPCRNPTLCVPMNKSAGKRRMWFFRMLAGIPSIAGLVAIGWLMTKQERIEWTDTGIRLRRPPVYRGEATRMDGSPLPYDPQLGWRNIPGWQGSTFGGEFINARDFATGITHVTSRPA